MAYFISTKLPVNEIPGMAYNEEGLIFYQSHVGYGEGMPELIGQRRELHSGRAGNIST